MRKMTLLWLPVALAVVVAAYVWGGGSARMLLHGASALVVLGGTLAATLISHPSRDVRRAMAASWRSFVDELPAVDDLTTRLMDYALRVHRRGMLALDAELETVADPYLRHALALAVDGVEPVALRETLQAESRAREAEDDTSVRVLETAAGYAPAFGMLGAVLGLVQVMSSLGQPGRFGGGIATAFVATIYGLTLANALLLPVAGRLRERLLAGQRRRAIIVDGVVALRQRTHPRLVAVTIRGAAGSDSWRNATLAPPMGGRPS